MSVIETYQSQSERITNDGYTMTRVYKITSYDEWTDLTNELPCIGDELDFDPNLIATELSVEWLSNSIGHVTAVYSTKGFDNRMDRPDEAGSWTSTTDAHTEDSYVDAYYDRTAGAWKSWSTVWGDRGETYTDDNKPPLLIKKVGGSYTLSVVSSCSRFGSLTPYFGKVNNSALVATVDSKKEATDASYSSAGSNADIGKWMLDAVRERRVTAKMFNIDMVFLYSAEGWNTQNGVAINAYETFNFSDLVSGLDLNTDDDTRGGDRQ